MAVIVVLVDLEFCTKSECVSVRFPRNFVRKISVNTNSTPIVGQTFTIDFESDNFTHPTRFCLALLPNVAYISPIAVSYIIIIKEGSRHAGRQQARKEGHISVI